MDNLGTILVREHSIERDIITKIKADQSHTGLAVASIEEKVNRETD